MSPSNLSDDNVKEFVNAFNINYIYSSDKDMVKIFKDNLTVEDTKIENLYKICEGKK